MIDRRDIVKLMGVGGIVCASGLAGAAATKKKSTRNDADFFFLQLSDTHWGYAGVSNPRADLTLKRAVATINDVAAEPDFVVFTGDLTHTTDDPAVRHRRMNEFKVITAGLKTKTLHLMPGEHDAAKDKGAAFREHFGTTHGAFDHKGVHFVTLDNVSDPEGAVGATQIDWLAADLKRVGPDARIVVFTHRPLFDLYPEWEWSTKDGAKVIDVLHALQTGDRVLRAYPPGTPPSHRTYRSPCGTVFGVSAARARVGSEKGTPRLGPGRTLQRTRLPRGGPDSVGRRRTEREGTSVALTA